MSIDKPVIYVAINPDLYAVLCTAETDAKLRELGEVRFQPGPENNSDLQHAAILDADIVMSSWGAKRFDEAMLKGADRLKLIAHAAGSVRGLCPDPVWDRNIAVSSAAPAIAPAVAEWSVISTMLCLRKGNEQRLAYERGERRTPDLGKEINGAKVGVVGAGQTGRFFIQKIKALGADVYAYDPYLTEDQATQLGVTITDLPTMFATCDAVSLQAPVTDETKGMITAELLAAMPDGASFINTARGVLVDQEALTKELVSGRINAALDVSTPEPLPQDHPLWGLDNVMHTPHMAGVSQNARHRQGEQTVEDIRRFLAGEPMKNEVTKDRLAILA